jgi:tRNA G18 (ribose-2'-O)-methylase SpoU
MKLNSSQLRTTPVDEIVKKEIKKNPIYIICDNVLDTYNVGAIFRLADATAATKVYLCGGTETPPNPKIKKASVNTWQWVEWEYASSASEVIKNLKLKIKNCCVVSVEQNERSIPLKEFKAEFPIVLVVGNETHGVSKEVLDLSDTIVELPMFGINTSLNVMVTLGIVLYRVIEFL